ncbi:MAG: antitermination protein NusG [Ilumatobacteraceae bacterium]
MLADGLFSRLGMGQFGLRWLHILAGITWIGLLYYFNFVQVPAFAEFGDEARARNIAIDKVARKALWWFRWSALSTFVIGILITMVTKDYFSNDFGKQAGGIGLVTGMLLGTIMMLNVWGVIWRNQKVVLANAANLVAGGEADPDAAAAGRRSFMASRQNVVFSVAMLFFMVFKTHSPVSGELVSSARMGTYWAISIVIIAVLELNALGLMPWKATPNKGLNMMYDGPGVRNVLVSSFGVWFVFMILSEIFLKA